MDKFKICFLNLNSYHLFDPTYEGVPGGMETKLFILAHGLEKRGHQIAFVTDDRGQKSIQTIDGIKVIKSADLSKANPINYIKSFFKIWKALKRSKSEIFITSGTGLEPGLLALFCKLKNKKFIFYTANDKGCSWEYIRANGLIGKIYHYGLRNADLIIVQKKESQDMLMKHHSLKSTVIKNPRVIKDDDVRLQKEDFLLWVGRLDKVKNPESLIKIAQRLPDQKIVMIAPPQKHQIDFANKIKALVKKTKNIKYIPGVPFEKVMEYHRKAKLFICTSITEGFPNTHIEACIGRTPIVTLNINPENYIVENNIGYAAEGDLDKMVSDIKNILNNQTDWEIKSKSAYKYAKKNHDIEKIAKEWELVINEEF